MNKNLKFNIEEAARFFCQAERTENEEYLLDIILQLGKQYNSLIDNYNLVLNENGVLKNKLNFNSHSKRI